MSLIGKLIGMVLAGNALVESTPLFHRLLRGVAAIVGLAIVSALLVSALLGGLFYAVFRTLVAHGQSPDAALLEIAIAVVIVLAVCVSKIMNWTEELKEIPVQILELHSPLTTRTQGIVSSFMDGFAKSRGQYSSKVYPFKKTSE